MISQFFCVFSTSVKSSGAKFIIYLIITASLVFLLEILGVYLISVIGTSLFASENNQISKVISYLNSYNLIRFELSNNNLILFLVFLFMIRTALLQLSYWFLAKSLFSVRKITENKMLRSITFSNLSYIRDRPYEELLRDFTADLNGMTSSLRAWASLSVEVLVVLGLLLVVSFTSSSVIFWIIFSAIFYIVLFIFVLRYLQKLGIKKRIKESERYSKLLSIINLAKEIRVFDVRGEVSVQANKIASDLSSLEQRHLFVSFLPRSLLEICLIVAILIYVLTLTYGVNLDLNNSQEPINFSFLIVALLRVLPSLNRISSSLNALSFNHASVLSISNKIDKYNSIEEKKLFSKNTNIKIKKLNNTDLIKIENFVLEVDGRQLFHNLNLALPKNGLIVISGDSGIGKSTFLEIIMGLVEKNDPKINWSGNIFSYKSVKFAFVAQSAEMLDASLSENIRFFRNFKKGYNITGILELSGFDLNDKNIQSRNLINSGLNLSGGELQRLSVARAICGVFDILVLDESTSNVDKNSKKIMLTNIRELSKSKLIIFISHDSEVIEGADMNVNLNSYKV